MVPSGSEVLPDGSKGFRCVSGVVLVGFKEFWGGS